MTDFTEIYPVAGSAVEEPAEKNGLLLRDRRGRIRVKDPARARALKWFLSLFTGFGVAALFFMDLDWAQVWEGVLRIPEAIGKPVSYTHLDVYKRQAHRPAVPGTGLFPHPAGFPGGNCLHSCRRTEY